MSNISLDIQEAIRLHKAGRGQELHGNIDSKILKAAVYGANDGIITTFAVIVGVAGAGLAPSIVLILGFASLLADGIAMGIGDYLGERSEQRFKRHQYEIEQWEVANIPEEESVELKEHLSTYGVNNADAQQLSQIVQKYPKLWAHLGFMEEMGELPAFDLHLWHSGVATFFAFVFAGALPLAPYFVHALGAPLADSQELFFSVLSTGIALFVIGSLRTFMTKGTWWRNGLEMLLIGAVAAVGAYISGVGIKKLLP